MISSVAYLLARRLLGCLMVLARREVSKDAGTRGGPLGALGKSTLRGCGPDSWHLVPFNLNWYHVSMALNIKDPETERLAAEVAALTGTTKTGAVRYALRQVLQAQSRLSVQQREERLTRFLEEEIWPLVPPDQLGKPVSKAEREEILGFGEHGA